MAKENEERGMLAEFAKWGKLIGVAFIGLGALFGNGTIVGLGALKVVGGKIGEDYFKKKKQ